MSASIAGIILTSYLGTSKADFGKELTLPIITAVVLGGTSTLGGRGSVIGTALAALVIWGATFSRRSILLKWPLLSVRSYTKSSPIRKPLSSIRTP